MPGKPPAEQGRQRDHQHHRHKHGTDLVYQPLNRRLARLGVLHQPDDAGQHRLAAHGAHLHDDTAIPIDRATCKQAARLFGHRQGLARQHGFIHLRLPFEHRAIHGEAFPRFDRQAVCYQHLRHGHVGFPIGPQQMRGVGPQCMQCSNRRGGLPPRPNFQPLAQQHQGDDDSRALEIQVNHHLRVGAQPQPHRQGPARRGAQRHQQIHVAGEILQRAPARFVKPGAQNELHRRGQQELPQRGQHPVFAEQVGNHRQHQRRRQRQPDADRQEARPRRQLGLVHRRFRRTGLVTGVAH